MRADNTTPFMREEVARRSLEFLFSHANQAAGLSLILWGGEPLLNPRLLESVLTYARRLSTRTNTPLRVATTTNATLLTQGVIDLLIEHRVVVNLSLDGNAVSHDANRTFKNGKGSYSTVERSVCRLVEAGRRCPGFPMPMARMTLSHSTVKSFVDNHKAIWALGVPIVWCKDVDWLPDGSDLALTDEDYVRLASEYEVLRKYIIDELDRPDGARFWPQLNWDLGRLHTRVKRTMACGAGHSGVTVGTDGQVWVCYHLTGRGGEYLLGDIWEGARTQDRQAIYSQICYVDELSTCRECELKYFCDGRCFAKAIFHGLHPSSCWTGQCKFIRTYRAHCLHLYAALMRSKHVQAVRTHFEPKLQKL